MNARLLLALGGVLSLAAAAAFGDDEDRAAPAVKLLTTIPVPGVGMKSFDISWVDAGTQRYYLADRSNQAVDVVDSRPNSFVKQIHGGFAGFSGNNDTSGPNGVVVSGHWLFVTDAPSRLVTIDLGPAHIVREVSPGGAAGCRADEIAFHPVHNLLLPVNNADDPPFAT